ncbi:unnamed protein product [Nezara viridula]|uniref:Uncharacterized protein n=1 Tax=Nezara viridula TaxID=85310 RepID=A0A9P0HJB0_NEZVI|nr:unnamed protein product [Nezara viridula]
MMQGKADKKEASGTDDDVQEERRAKGNAMSRRPRIESVTLADSERLGLFCKSFGGVTEASGIHRSIQPSVCPGSGM